MSKQSRKYITLIALILVLLLLQSVFGHLKMRALSLHIIFTALSTVGIGFSMILSLMAMVW